MKYKFVLNLVISGIPSIRYDIVAINHNLGGFKPCYKWNTFNTCNLKAKRRVSKNQSFKPCYKWNTFNTDYVTVADYIVSF